MGAIASLALSVAQRVLAPGGLFGIDLVPDVPNWREYSDQVQMRARAVLVTDGKLRKMYLELARQWCQLAEDPELLDRKRRLD